MPERPDKRRRTDLDLFVLALIDSGFSTPYDLQKGAGLSQGATTPALQRLTEARLVRQSKPGSRGRIDYKTTASGRTSLKDGWQALIEAGPSGDLDSDLRVALLAVWIGGERRQATEFLRKSADRKRDMVSSNEIPDQAADLPPLARWYTELRASLSRALLTAESAAIREIADTLSRKRAK
jgi:DNA-binding PadR family transcriptional regulator